jgi:uncharacterized protein (TIGR03437 family)
MGHKGFVFRYIGPVLLVASAAAAAPANPPRLSYATYVGTPSGAVVYGFAVDSAGNAYVSGAYRGCAFLTKLNQTGTAVVWSVCLPMTQVNSVAVDAAGYIYVAGGNQMQAFEPVVSTSTIMKLSPDAQQTVYSRVIGGTYASKLILDRTGNVYITGLADSSFQTTAGAYLTVDPSAGWTVFALKLNTSGTVQYATYLDFLYSLDVIADIGVDSMGQAWVVGQTCPATAGPVGANCDIFVYGTAIAIRKLDANGATLLVKKNFGGGRSEVPSITYRDRASGVAVDSTDSAWIVGTAETNQVPTTAGTIEPQRPFTGGPPGNGIGYAVKFSPSGDLVYGTYVGTNPGDRADHTIASVAVDGQGRPYFALNLPRPSFSGFGCGSTAAAVMALSSDASTVLLSRDILGPVQTIALDGNGGLYTAGNGANFGFLATPGAYQPIYPGGSIAGYAAKFDLTEASASQFVCMVSAASLVPGDNPHAPEGAVAPGEIVTVVGENLPPNPRVNFDGQPAPILYADAHQINAVVPFEVSAPNTVVSVEGVGGFRLPVWPAVPALFTTDFSGQDQVAALNQDLSINSNTNPAKAGAIVAVYMTGVGAMTPPIGDGQLGPLQPPFPAPVLGVSATVNNAGAPILFAGQAPGLIAGAVQVNVQIPEGTASGNAVLVVYIGNFRTQIGLTTIAVQ